MAQHHAFRRAGRTAGVEESREVVFGDAVAEWPCVALVDQRFVTVGQRNDVRNEVGKRRGIAIGEEYLRARVLQCVAHFRIRMASVERHDDEPAGRHRDIRFDVAHRIRREDCDPITGNEPEATQSADQSFTALRELRVGELRVAVDQRNPVRTDLQCAL